MNDTLNKNLHDLLNKNRVVFWYDSKKEFAEDFEEFSDDNVIKVELTGDNDFRVKYDILKLHPESKFLLYAPFDEPSYEDNWLLDIELSNDVFRTDICAIYLSELNLPSYCFDIIKKHEAFFKAEKRRNDLVRIHGYNSSSYDLLKAMAAVCAGLDCYKLNDLVIALIKEEFLENKKRIYDALESSSLLDFVWQEISENYQYSGSSIRDFALTLYERSFSYSFSSEGLASNDSMILMASLKNNLDEDDLKAISDYAFDQLGMQLKLSSLDWKALVSFDDYKDIDCCIIDPIAALVENGAITSKEIQDVISKRKDFKWYSDYDAQYNALLYGEKVIECIKSYSYDISSYVEGIQNYKATWYKADYSYRKFSEAIQSSMMSDSIYKIKKLVDNKYLNSFLRPLNESWSKYAESFLRSGWKNTGYTIKERFYPSYVKKILDDRRTAVVIISDALRYEVGEELAAEINKENRYSAVVDAAISSVPSYTQADMASLLPCNVLTISPDGDEVFVDGKSSKGSQNREAILNSYSSSYSAKVLDINDVLNNMDTSGLRNIIRDNKLVYIYQNVIDARGENDLIAACSDAIAQLKKLVKKLGSSNVTNMFITSDHGFLFQNQDLNDYDFLSEGSIRGDKITKKNRRFVLGYGLQETEGTVVTELSNIGYGNDDGLEVSFPNSIIRFRLSGADTHFVHGGLCLEEIVIPVLTVTKGRSEDISFVELQMLTKPDKITTGSISLKFYQCDYVSDKNRGFNAYFGIYAENGALISNSVMKSITSDSLEVRDREFSIDLSLSSQSNKYRNQNVYIIVKQQVDNDRTKDIIKVPVLLKKNNAFGELDF